MSILWRYTEEHSKASVHWHTVLGSSHWSQWGNAVRSTYTRVYNCARDHRMRLMQLFPLSLHSNGMRPTYTPVRMKSSSWLQQKQQQQQQKNVQGDSFGTTEDAVPHWPRLDVCRPRRARNMNSRKLLCPRFTGGKIRRPSLWSKGTVSGSVLFSGRTGCVDQADDAVLLPLPPCCCRQSHKYTSIQEARGKRFQSFTGQVPRHSTRQPRPSNRSFVTENIETTASVSYHNRCHVKLQHQFRITTGVT